MPVFKKVNKNFFKKWTPEMAYVLGFFAADGYITVNKRGGQFWCLHIADIKLLREIRKSIGSNHKIGVREKPRYNSITYRLQIGSIEMCDDLRRLGFNERKTKSLAIPNISLKYFADFVRGYFDGDGNVWVGEIHKEREKVSYSMRTEFTSCSREFLFTLKSRLEKFGISGGSLICQKGYFRLKYSLNNSKIIYRLIYENIGNHSLYLPRKKVVFEKYFKISKMRR